MENQAYIFFIFILNGFLIGLIFDIFRILRQSFKTKDFITYIEDIIFWVITGILILNSIFKFNNGEIRGYIFIGIIIGTILYLLLFSKLFIRINVLIINLLKKAIYYVLIVPIKSIISFLKTILLKPISFIVINLKKVCHFLKLNIKILIKNIKNKNTRRI